MFSIIDNCLEVYWEVGDGRVDFRNYKEAIHTTDITPRLLGILPICPSVEAPKSMATFAYSTVLMPQILTLAVMNI